MVIRDDPRSRLSPVRAALQTQPASGYRDALARLADYAVNPSS
ncbi:MAG TPA: hypothetical protein VF292_01170 [Rhodanobacteraceae bacterium]